MFFEKTAVTKSPWSREATREVSVDPGQLQRSRPEQPSDTRRGALRETMQLMVAPWVIEIMGNISNNDTVERHFVALQTDY